MSWIKIGEFNINLSQTFSVESYGYRKSNELVCIIQSTSGTIKLSGQQASTFVDYMDSISMDITDVKSDAVKSSALITAIDVTR